jgi:hypothetical protein
METVGFNGVANRIGVDAEFSGDGADFPMLGVKVTADLNVGFWIDHLVSSGSRNWWERIDETAAPAADGAAQECARRLFGPALAIGGGRSGDPR